MDLRETQMSSVIGWVGGWELLSGSATVWLEQLEEDGELYLEHVEFKRLPERHGRCAAGRWM